MKIDVTKTVQANFLALVIDANATASGLSLSQFTLGTVAVLTGNATKNSQVVLTAIKNMGYSGAITLNFNRLSVSSGVKTLPTAISINPADTQAIRITKVATALGLIQSEVTITGAGGGDLGTPANEDDTTVSVTVTPNASSSLYVGSALTIQLTTPDTDIPLSSIITVVDMNGFEAVT
jgi:hypothetical protein